jgi:8-oxo-dGTP diphosphatase
LKEVVRAIIRNTKGEILVGLRSVEMGFWGYWELPGGKIEEGQTPTEALKQELIEELSFEPANVYEEPVHETEYSGVLTSFYIVDRLDNENVFKNEHEKLLWIKPKFFKSLRWSPHHDMEILLKIEKYLS